MHIKRHMWKADLQIVLAAVLALGAATLVPVDSAQAKFKVLYAFSDSDGSGPWGRLTRKAHILYGATQGGGSHYRGAIFKLARDGTETVLHSFSDSDGTSPNGGLVMDDSGDLYGSTSSGGEYDHGTLFRLAPDGTLTTLYTFTRGNDGAEPRGGMIMDNAGNLYGTGATGGVYDNGTLFKLAPDGTLTTLHSFTGGSDGRYPNGDLIMDKAGNLYGTTQGGGAYLAGSVFKVTPDGVLITLYSLTGWSDGLYPQAGVTMDGKANLYGTASQGGAHLVGTVFKLAPDGNLTTLHTFGSGQDGAYPHAGLIMDESGNLYGTTVSGGRNGLGVVYKLASNGAFTVLRSLREKHDGAAPAGSLILGAGGKLYGTTQIEGPHRSGTVFRLSSQEPNDVAEDER